MANHELHGPWHSYVIQRIPGGDFRLVPDGRFNLSMTNAATGQIQQGSTHDTISVTGQAVPVDGLYDVTINEASTPTGGGHLYQGSLVSRIDLGSGQRFLIITGTRRLPSPLAAKETKTKGKARAISQGLAAPLSQEEDTWVATKP